MLLGICAMYVVIKLHTRKFLSFMHLAKLLASLLHIFLVEGRGRETNKQRGEQNGEGGKLCGSLKMEEIKWALKLGLEFDVKFCCVLFWTLFLNIFSFWAIFPVYYTYLVDRGVFILVFFGFRFLFFGCIHFGWNLDKCIIS